jgi:ankyrin repeat protein
MGGTTEAAVMLVRAGANANAQNHNSQTPLEAAIAESNANSGFGGAQRSGPNAQKSMYNSHNPELLRVLEKAQQGPLPNHFLNEG